MIKMQLFLTFDVHGLLLAIDADIVREIIWLPKLTVIEEQPASIAGAFNLRGAIVPVMDLNIRFGRPLRRYTLSDRVIILSIPEYEIRGRRCGPRLLGVIVNDVHEVIDIAEADIERPPFPEREDGLHPFFVRGTANAGEKIVMVIDPARILDFDFIVEGSEIPESGTGDFFPDAIPEEKAIFNRRALELRQAPDSDDRVKSTPIVVVGLNSELFCVTLKAVHEFTKLRDYTPLPCCPEHIAGTMNLRGSVLTLVDIRTLLNMPPVKPSESSKVIVADTGDVHSGVVVDDILDVVYLKPSEIAPMPAVVGGIGEKFIQGTAPYGGRMMSILDLEGIMGWEGLVVNEEA